MKMLNCPECGLTITDTQEACPKCRTKIEDIKGNAIKRSSKKKNPKKTASNKIKEEMIEAVIRAEAAHASGENNEPTPQEKIIAAVVEAEALAAIQEEKNETQNLCTVCLSPLAAGQSDCQACQASASEAFVLPKIPKTDEEAHKWLAAIGYIFFFIPLIYEHYKASAFAKFHAKQATTLFIANVIFFLVLIAIRSVLDRWFFMTSPVLTDFPLSDYQQIRLTSSALQYHHHGVAGRLFYFYLEWMIYFLHFLPFAFAIIGILNALQGKKQPLPVIGHFVSKEEEIDAQTTEVSS
ncbi:MAG: hypothetical protein FWG67_08015 [Defluviitaleaceae bacterium]|nr:hypothetical protein [Defluviitaleaceae bacterium]